MASSVAIPGWSLMSMNASFCIYRWCVLVFDEPQGAARQLEQDDVGVASLRRLWEMSQHAGRVPPQRFMARLLPRILLHLSRRSDVHTRFTTGKSWVWLFVAWADIRSYSWLLKVKSNEVEFICDTKQNINECDIILRQMCRQDTKAVPTALTGALGSNNTNYNSK